MLEILKPTALIAFLAAAPLFGTTAQEAPCSYDEPANCNEEECCFTYCYGPEETAINSPVNPRTCKGDLTLTFNPFYWKATQDGMEFAIKNRVLGADTDPANLELNNLIQAQYITPHYGWDFGFQLGAGYNSNCDGWDVGILWTRYSQCSNVHEEAEIEDNQSLLPLWSGFQFPLAGDAPIIFATDAKGDWNLDLDLIHIDLGRAAWVSRYVIMRPRIGVSLCQIKEEFDIEYRGGSFNNAGAGSLFTDLIELTSKYRGIGILTGLDTTWNLSCGFSLFGNVAASILYGRFHLDHIEWFRETTSPFNKIRFIDTEQRLRVARAATDLLLGVQWSALFCECRYGFTIGISWEQHLFFNQNQFWQIKRVGGETDSSMPPFNDSGQNVFEQRRGDLSTSGVTLRAKFEF